MPNLIYLCTLFLMLPFSQGFLSGIHQLDSSVVLSNDRDARSMYVKLLKDYAEASRRKRTALIIPQIEHYDKIMRYLEELRRLENRDHRCLLTGTENGLAAYSTHTDEFDEQFSLATNSAVPIVCRLFTSSLLMYVTEENSRILILRHIVNNTEITKIRQSYTIFAVRSNRERLVLCVEDGIHIFEIEKMKQLHVVKETPANRNGVIALSLDASKNNYLAYPGSQSMGTIIIFDCNTLQNVHTIAAHNGVLASLVFNYDGNLLASASEKGTVIRVFSIPHCIKLLEFRRSVTRCATISSLYFSLSSEFLVAASNTSTIHIFQIDQSSSRRRTVSSCSAQQSENNENMLSDTSDTVSDDTLPSLNGLSLDHNPLMNDKAAAQGWFDWIATSLRSSTNYLPIQMSDVLSQDRAFSWARITHDKSANVKKVAAIVE